jgi:hypothetical protein
VVALSVGDEPTTTELIAKHHLSFPVGHGADEAAVSPRPALTSIRPVGSCSPPGSTRPRCSVDDRRRDDRRERRRKVSGFRSSRLYSLSAHPAGSAPRRPRSPSCPS